MNDLTFAETHLPTSKMAIVKSELESIQIKHGNLNPELVLANAEKESSPLHDHFTWDDSEAARKCRIAEAYMLIRSVKIKVTVDSREPINVRAYIAISRPEGQQRSGYVSLTDALKNPEQRSEMVSRAMRELESFRKKYGILTELSAVFSAMKKTEKAINKGGK